MKTLFIAVSAFVFAPLPAQEQFYLAPGTIAPFGLDSMEITALAAEPGNIQHSISDLPLFAGTRNGGIFAILPFSTKSKWQSIGFSGKTISCLNVRRFSAGPLSALTLQTSVAFTPDSTREFIANGFFPQPPFAVDTTWRIADNDTAKQTLRAVYSMAGANENSPVVGMNKTVLDYGGGVVAGGSRGVMRLQLNSSESYPTISLDSMVVNCLEKDWNNSGLTLAGGSLNGKPVIYRSTNAGMNWTVTSFSSGDSGTVNTMGLVTRTQVDTVYAGTDGGFWQSVDGGGTWRQNFLNGPVEIMAVDQVHSSLLFASWKNIPGFFQSRDGGSTWMPIGQDINIGTITSMVVMYPASIDSLPYIFLGTIGTGVWVYRPTSGKTQLSKPFYFPLAKGDLWEYRMKDGGSHQYSIVSDTVMPDGYSYAHIRERLGLINRFQRVQGDSVIEYSAYLEEGFVRYDLSSELGLTYWREFSGLQITNIQLNQDTVFGRWLRKWSSSSLTRFDFFDKTTIVDSLGVTVDLQGYTDGNQDNLLGAIIDGVQYGTFTTSISSQPRDNVPRAFRLEQNYPNPFNPSTTISYALPHRSHVTLTVYNTLGQQVATLVNSDIDAGYHDIQFNANNLASGVYFYRIQAGSYVETRKLVYVR